MTRRPESVLRTQDRVSRLVQDFDSYCDSFDAADVFTGPSLYFHLKTISILRRYESSAEALRDQAFVESLYATLAAWGMHRMGPGGAKLADFHTMSESLSRIAPQIQDLAPLKLLELGIKDVGITGRKIWEVISTLKVGVGDTRIVSGSKALHHILPELVPPIDREYTIRFFLHNKNLYGGEDAAFTEIFGYFHQIAAQRRSAIEARVGRGMNTSQTKVIDNAIVAFVRTHLKED